MLKTLQNIDNGHYITKTSKMWDRDKLIKYEYHVIYNANYAVPVLSFLAWNSGTVFDFLFLWSIDL